MLPHTRTHTCILIVVFRFILTPSIWMIGVRISGDLIAGWRKEKAERYVEVGAFGVHWETTQLLHLPFGLVRVLLCVVWFLVQRFVDLPSVSPCLSQHWAKSHIGQDYKQYIHYMGVTLQSQLRNQTNIFMFTCFNDNIDYSIIHFHSIIHFSKHLNIRYFTWSS